ncbi:MAG: cytoplasmic protein [Desulfobacterales bacterium]
MEKMQSDLRIDTNNLYREENITDLHAGSIRRLVPVNLDGSIDRSRTEIFVGTTQLMTPGGALPVQAGLEANNLEEAIAGFPAAMSAAIEEMIQEIQKMAEEERRNTNSRIIVPGQS